MSEKLDQVRDEVGRHMDSILECFKLGAKITVLVRKPDNPEADFLMTNEDSLSDASEALAQRENPCAGIFDHK